MANNTDGVLLSGVPASGKTCCTCYYSFSLFVFNRFRTVPVIHSKTKNPINFSVYCVTVSIISLRFYHISGLNPKPITKANVDDLTLFLALHGQHLSCLANCHGLPVDLIVFLNAYTLLFFFNLFISFTLMKTLCVEN